MNGGLFNNGAGTSTVDCHAILDSHLPDRLATLIQMGVLVAIGTTRDRGALSITITHDGDYDRTYVRSSDEATDYLERAIDSLRAMGLGQPATDPTTVQKPTRRRQRLT
jgi:hypothetical protein